ncbi:hypothetical protein, partial [Bradyrhizobium sp.]|uniref:hypothetical protein n=1 Tax=Bradyrhizobium sp. TaxID=376 RepID=UPI003C551DFF
MGRYKDYDRGPKRGGYDDEQKSDDRASGVRPNYPRPSAPAERRPAIASQVVGSTTESIGNSINRNSAQYTRSLNDAVASIAALAMPSHCAPK